MTTQRRTFPLQPVGRTGSAFAPVPGLGLLRPLCKGGAIRWLPGLTGRGVAARDRHGLDPVLGRLGSLEVRLATTAKEIRQLDARTNAPVHPFGGFGEAPHRSCDGAGEQHRQQYHHARGD